MANLSVQIRSTVNELVGVELSPKLYPILLTQIMIVVNSFFTPSGQVSLSLSVLKIIKKQTL